MNHLATASLCSLLLAGFMRGEASATPSVADEGRSLVLPMQLRALERSDGSGLLVVADFISGAESAKLEIRVPPGHWKKDDRSPPGLNWYRFPVFFASTDKGREVIDRLLRLLLPRLLQISKASLYLAG